MAGKMIFGDIKQPAPFRTATKIDIIKEGKKVIVVCSTPHAIKAQFPALEIDLLEQIARDLKGHGVMVVNPDEVAKWMDDHGGFNEDPQELAEHFDADLIIHADLSKFSYLEENSPTLFRGRANGDVRVYEVVKGKDEAKRVRQIFVSEYVSVYPQQYPVSQQNMSEATFRKRYLDQVSAQISRMFYDYRSSDEID
jgi:hypothetical protein